MKSVFNRRRKVMSLLPAGRDAETITLRVLVDSGPAARDMFAIRVTADDSIETIRAAVANQIGISSMCLFKVSIPWQAQYEASAYATRYGASPSLLSVFPGWNLDDPSQLAASGGADFPAYIQGSGSLRSRRRGNTFPQAADVTVRHWFPIGADDDKINILVRTASISSLDWARPPSPPITLAVRFAHDRRRRAGLPSLPSPGFKGAGDCVLVDISPDATVAELKVSLLLAAGRPAPAGLLDAIILWRVEMTEPELQAVELSGGLSRGRRPSPYPPHALPPLCLDNAETRIGDYLPNFRSQRGNPRSVTISAWVNPAAADELAPRSAIPRFQYPMPDVLPPPTRAPLRPLPQLSFDSPTPSTSSDSTASWGSSNTTTFLSPSTSTSTSTSISNSTHRCCPGRHDGGLIGLGIIMSPMSAAHSVSDHGSSDDEAFSWPPTPVVGGDSDEATWLGPSPTAPAWGHEGDPEPDREQATTPKGFSQTDMPAYGNTFVL